MNIAILGLGTVGGGAYEIIREQGLEYGLSVKRVFGRSVKPGFEDIMTTNVMDVIQDESIDLVIESIGGMHPAYEYCMAALNAKKHVVSANKLMIASHFQELRETAKRNGVEFRFTASAGGGIPWLYNLKRAKRTDDVSELFGIINGTTNFILYNMFSSGADFGDVLAEAQRLGYAEADPTADIDGHDVCHKCAISVNMAFDTAIDEKKIDVFGIRSIQKRDVEFFKSKRLTCKLLAVAKRQQAGLCAYVEPSLFPGDQLEALVPSNYNMISLVGRYTGRQTFYGQGAGKYPTGNSVVQDVVDIAQKIVMRAPKPRSYPVDNSMDAHRYYLRCKAEAAGKLNKDLILSMEKQDDEILYITREMPVSDMHRLANEIKKKDPCVFIAGLR